jgi:hypothetical protein
MTKKRTKSDILKESILSAHEKSLGNVSKTCKSVACSRDTFYRYCKEDKEFGRLINDIENIALDFVESQHYVNIAKGKEASIIFHLKTKGKNRGYFEKLQIEDVGEREPVHVEIVIPQRNENKGDN